MAKNPFSVGIFDLPGYSAFDCSHGNRVSTKQGCIKPVWCEYLDTGERAKDIDFGALVRQAPMLAPTLDTYDITIDFFACRLRTIGMETKDPWTYEDFFNLNKNVDGTYILPSFPLGRFWAYNNPLKLGTLYESLNYPSWKWLREEVMEYIRKRSFFYDPIVVARLSEGSDATSFSVVLTSSSLGVQKVNSAGYSTFTPQFNQVDSTFSFGWNGAQRIFTSEVNQVIDDGEFNDICLPTLVAFCMSRYSGAFDKMSPTMELDDFDNYGSQLSYLYQNGAGAAPFAESIALVMNYEPYNILDKIYEVYHVDALSVISEYEDYLMDAVLRLVAFNGMGEVMADDISVDYNNYRCDSLFSFVSTWLLGSLDDVPDVGDSSLSDRSLYSFLKIEYDEGVLVSFGWPTASQWQDMFPSGSDKMDKYLPDYYFNAYWKIISDWYINTALFEPNEFFLEHYMNPGTSRFWTDYVQQCNTLFDRYWKNDYFTSAFPSSQLGSAVGIPVNGTIIDFRNANAWQKLRERLQYAGSRWRDVLFAITGKRTSSAIMDLSEPVGRWFGTINVDSVLQQSASSTKSPQANYAGSGISYKLNGNAVSYTAEEPTVIMAVMSITPKSAAYFDGMPRKFLRSTIYEYDIPQLAFVGEQEIKNHELFFGMPKVIGGEIFSRFGWQRRFGDFMWFPDEVHGDFRGNLDYWHNARIFSEAPSLGEQFLQIRPEEDNLNRTFAVNSPVVDKFYCHVFVGGKIIRHLPKHAYYDL